MPKTRKSNKPSSERKVIVHVSDWNYQDKYYEASVSLVREFRTSIEANGMDNAWQLWIEKVDYNGNGSGVIKYGRVDMHLETYFLDYLNPIESVNEWEL